MALVEAWLQAPSSCVLEGGPRCGELFREALEAAAASPNLVDDAYLAAIAREHKATVITFDSGFGQFPAITWEQPRR